ncbi:hypothetical protein N752_01385 [Desulforamulus aquiferis]|nr:hypothetical protein N752_01385 [Desulforamulus aquiferis]
MHFNLTYHGGKYYVEAFKDIVDGTYIEKFSRL